MEIAEITPTIGVEVDGLDLDRPLSAADADRLREVFERRHLILVRGQALSPEQFSRFVGAFGTLVENRDGSPSMNVVSNVSGADITGHGRLLFHQDEVTYHSSIDHMPQAISLYAQDVSEEAAPTYFADAVQAARVLPQALRRRLEDAVAVHILDRDPGRRDYSHRTREADLPPEPDPARYKRAEYPALQRRANGEVALFVTEHQTSHLLGMPVDDSETLLQELFATLYADENIYEHHWRPYDLVIWSNIALQHARPAVGAKRRHFLRLSVGRASYYAR